MMGVAAVSVEAIVDSVGELQSNGKEMVQCTESLITQREEEVQRFLSEVLQEDKPTGLTPARVERSYPRTLAATRLSCGYYQLLVLRPAYYLTIANMAAE